MCGCELCKNYELYKWAIITECGCACHISDGESGHENLCCEFPNVLLKNNPYTDLKPASYYKDILDELGRKEYEYIDKVFDNPRFRKEMGLDEIQ